MSGALTPVLSGAASGHAMRALAQAKGVSIGEAIRLRTLESLGAHKPQRENLPAKTWMGIPEKTRLLLVMIGSSASGEPQRLCKQPWDSFSSADQFTIASAARELLRDLRDVSSLF